MQPALTVTRPRFAADSAYALAAVLAATSIAGIGSHPRYWFDLVVAVPALVACAWVAARGSWRAQLLLAGAQLYAIYTFAISCFAVPVAPVFVVHAAGFGLATYGTVANVAVLATRPPRGSLVIAVVLCFELLAAASICWLAISGGGRAGIVVAGTMSAIATAAVVLLLGMLRAIARERLA